jgi:outer membrane protein OmpA-like peptidoglycan-associated protein
LAFSASCFRETLHISSGFVPATPRRAPHRGRIRVLNVAQGKGGDDLTRSDERNQMRSTAMMKRTLIAATAMVLGASAAHAGENTLTKEEGAGMLGGAAVGAIVGGPFGAAVGLMFGGILGDSIGVANRANLYAHELEQELAAARAELAKASERSGGDQMLDALAERLHADVLFRTGAAELDVETASKIGELGALLAMHPQLSIELHGFADPRGDSEANLVLSMKRASAVRDALLNGGASPEQIRLSAHGEDLSTATEGDLEAYAWERRVSLAIRPNATTQVAQSR